MANYYHKNYNNRGNYRGYNTNRYSNFQQTKPQPNKNIPADLPPAQDIPPITQSTPLQDVPPKQSNQNFFNGLFSKDNPITSLFNLNGDFLDKDKLIILVLMYLLYKDGKKNLKLILALGYILM
ncbi:MAG: hypothetical protein ACI4WH_06885 [Oscillospiraceae bacterium]